MPSLLINEIEISYSDEDVLCFAEGLLGLPHLKRMVLVKPPSLEPLMWLASLDESGVAFVVAKGDELFSDYAPALPPESRLKAALAAGEAPLVLVIIVVAPDWKETTANLRAPLFVSARSMQAEQLILTDDRYQIATPLPFSEC